MYANRLIAVSTALLLSSVLASCSAGGSSDPSGSAVPTVNADDIEYDGPETGLPESFPEPPIAPEKGFTVGYMNVLASIPLLAANEAAAREVIESHGGNFLTKDDQANITTQVNHCNEFISQGVDAIILYPMDPASLTPCFEQAAAAGIPVITQNSPVDASQPPVALVNVVQGFDTAAYLRAKAVAERVPGATYAVLGIVGPNASLEYYAKRQRYWADQFGLTFLEQVDAQTDNGQDVSTASSAIFANNPDVQAVFAYNDIAAGIASTTARASGLSDVLILGSDGGVSAFDAIKNGTLLGTILKDPAVIGGNLAMAAISLIADPNADISPVVVAPSVWVDSSNVDSLTPVG